MHLKRFTNFTFQMKTEIVFGKGTEAQVGKLAKKYGATKVMLVYGGGSIKRSGLYDRVVECLSAEGLPFIELGGVKPNPLRSVAEAGLRRAMAEGVDFLLGVGGGSAIDTAKAIALGLANGGEYWRFYRGTPAEKMAPVGTINTIAAAGSETSGSSVLVDDMESGQKVGFNYPACRPVFAIMNPELTYTLPMYQLGAGIADIMAHTVGRYFSRSASALGDAYGEATMRTIARYGELAVKNPLDYEARAEVMLAASFSHNDVTGIGRSGPSGGEHALESQLSGYYDTAHGAGLAVVMPVWLEYVVRHGSPEQIHKVAQFGVQVFGVQPDFEDPVSTALLGLDHFRRWLKAVGMPLTLKELGVPGEDLEAVVDRCMARNGGMVRGFMDLDRQAVEEIFASVVE